MTSQAPEESERGPDAFHGLPADHVALKLCGHSHGDHTPWLVGRSKPKPEPGDWHEVGSICVRAWSIAQHIATVEAEFASALARRERETVVATLEQAVKDLRFEMQKVPLGQAFHGGSLHDAPVYDVMGWGEGWLKKRLLHVQQAHALRAHALRSGEGKT